MILKDKVNTPCFKKSLLVLIFFFAFALRLFNVFHNPVTFDHGIGIDHDSHLYHRIAYNLYSGNGFTVSKDGSFEYGAVTDINSIEFEPEIGRAPVYPLFIAAVYKVFADPADMESIETWHKNWDKVRIAQSFIDALTCFMIFALVRIILPDSFWPALTAAFLYSFNPLTIVFTKQIMRESLGAFMLTGAVLLYIIALKKKEWYRIVLAGLAFGLLVLLRPEYIFSLFLLAAYVFFVNRQVPSDGLKKSIVFLFIAFAAISPWTIRNYMVFEKPIIISVGGRGYGTFIGSFMTPRNWTYGSYPDEIFDNAQEKERVEALRVNYLKAMRSGTMEIKKYDDEFVQLTLERIREHPVEVALVWLERLPFLWYQNYNANPHQIKSFFIGNYFVFYALFAVLAFLKRTKEEKILMGSIALLFVYLTLVLIPTPAIPRYGIPMMPLIISLAGIGSWQVIEKFLGRMLSSPAREA